MNKKSIQEKARIIQMICEGNSMRATARMNDCSLNTVTKLLVEVGCACKEFHDSHVIGLNSKRVQCDEIWSFVYSKERNVPLEERGKGQGDVWTWTAIDADSKLIISWHVGRRDSEAAYALMKDVASRVTSRIQLTTDGNTRYLQAVEHTFDEMIDYAQLVKLYGAPEGTTTNERRYSPAECTGTRVERRFGFPDPKHISTSFVERQNLTIRMHNRRFTRLTNAFSKKVENHKHSIALNFVYYNFIRTHKTLRVTPAMEAGLTHDFMTYEDVARLSESHALKSGNWGAPKP